MIWTTLTLLKSVVEVWAVLSTIEAKLSILSIRTIYWTNFPGFWVLVFNDLFFIFKRWQSLVLTD